MSYQKVQKKASLIVLIAAFSIFGLTGDVRRDLTTLYDADGRPLNQGQDNKGLHDILGSATMSSGRATVSLNPGTGEGQRDVSFLSAESYGGFVWSCDSTNTNTYRLVPISATEFRIISSSGSDTQTIYYLVRGH